MYSGLSGFFMKSVHSAQNHKMVYRQINECAITIQMEVSNIWIALNSILIRNNAGDIFAFTRSKSSE